MHRSALTALATLILLAACSGASPTSTGSTATSDPTASQAAVPVGGQFTYGVDFGNVLGIDVDGSSDGSSLSGTAVVSDEGVTLYRVELQCLRRFDDQTWMLAGAVTPEPEGQDLIKWWALIVRDGSPQLVGVSGEVATAAEDCEEFVNEIPDRDLTDANLGPILEGEISVPPAPPNLP